MSNAEPVDLSKKFPSIVIPSTTLTAVLFGLLQGYSAYADMGKDIDRLQADLDNVQTEIKSLKICVKYRDKECDV